MLYLVTVQWLTPSCLFGGRLDPAWQISMPVVVKAHQHSSGAHKGEEAAIGKSVGSHTTKISMVADSMARPVEFDYRKPFDDLLHLTGGRNWWSKSIEPQNLCPISNYQ